MKIEFKNVATVADIKKAFEKAEIPMKLKSLFTMIMTLLLVKIHKLLETQLRSLRGS